VCDIKIAKSAIVATGYFGNRSHGLDHSGSSVMGDSRGGVVGNGSGDGLHNGGNGDGLDQGLTVDNGVESVDGIGGVLDGSLVAIGVDQGVLSADHVAIALLHLALGVSGEGVLNIVGVLVLGMGIVLLGGLGKNRLGVGNGDRCLGVGGHGGGGVVHLLDGQNTGVGGGDQGEEGDELKEGKQLGCGSLAGLSPRGEP